MTLLVAGGSWVFEALVCGQLAFYEFSTRQFRANEDAGQATINIVRSGDPHLDFSVAWFARSGTATAGIDFQGVTNTIHFAPGETNKTAIIPLIDDGLLEEPEEVMLSFGSAPGGATTGSVNQASLIIEDNEVPSLIDGSFRMPLEPDDDVFTVLLQNDGKIIMGGDFSGLGTNQNFVVRPGVARLNGDGSVDRTFVTADELGPGIYAVAQQPDGKIVVGGGFTGANNGFHFLARLNPDGSLDSAFLPLLNDEIRAIVVQPDAKILIAGRFTLVNGQVRGRLARLNPDGSLDSTFVTGLGANNNIRTMIRQDDGRILIGGQFTSYDNSSRVRVARLEANGALDSSFDPAAGANGQVRALAVATDGKVYLGGDFTAYGGLSRSGLVRALPGGGADPEFNAGLPSGDTVRAILIQPDDRVVAGGSFKMARGKPRLNLARFLPDGLPDPTLLTLRGPDDEVFALARQTDGSMLVGGQFLNVAGLRRAQLARLRPDSRVPTVEYTAEDFVTTEASSLALISLRRAGESFGDVAATCFTAPGTATPGSDYLSFSNVLHFGALQVTQSFSITILKDILAEPVETVSLVLTNVVGAAPGAARKADLLIDGIAGESIAVYPPNLYEDRSEAGFLVVRMGPTNFPLTLYYNTRDGTAVAGLDYQPVAGVFQLAAGVTSGYINLQPLNDSEQEGTEHFFLDLRESAQGPVFLSTPVPIFDNELGMGFVVARPDLVEAQGAVTVYVQCLWDPMTPVQVDYATRELGAARAGADFQARSGALFFTTNGEIQSITIPIVNDGVVEDPESFALFLTVAHGPMPLIETNLVFTIFDNDQGIEFVTNSIVVGENESSVVLGVHRRDDGNQTVTVEYATSDAGATAGADYNGASGTLVLPPGPEMRTFTIPLRDDALLETDETFRVFLRNPTGGASLGGTTSVVVRLLDNERPGSQDPKFDPRALLTLPWDNGQEARLAFQPDGRILFSASSSLLRISVDGQIDPSFDGGRIYFGTFVPLVQPDGRILVGATSSNSLGDNRCIFRLLNNSQNDESFSTAAVPVGHTETLLLQPDSRILIGGSYDDWVPAPNNGLIRLEANGQIDPSFNPGSFEPRSFWTASRNDISVQALALQPDGRILVAGAFHSLAGNRSDRVTRLLRDGSPDPTFFRAVAAAETNQNAFASALALQPDGKILVGGQFSSLQGAAAGGLIRLNPDGTPDVTFQAQLGPGASVRTIRVLPDGDILVGGADWATGMLVRLKANGSLDETFDVGSPPNGTVTDLMLLPDGDVLAAGAFTLFNGVARRGLVRLNAASVAYSRLALAPTEILVPEGNVSQVTVTRRGETNLTTTVDLITRAGTATPGEDFEPQQLQLTFRPGEGSKTLNVPIHRDWLSEDDEFFELTLTNATGGPSLLVAPTTTITILDRDRPGAVDPTFETSFHEYSTVECIAVQPDGRILVGGSRPLDGLQGSSYVRLNADGSLDPTFQSDSGDAIHTIVLQPDGRILLGGEFNRILNQSRVGMVRLLANGAVDPSFVSPFDDLGNGNRRVSLIVLQGDGRILVGAPFARINGQAVRGMVRLFPDGQPDPSFDPGRPNQCILCSEFGNGVVSLAPLPDGKILAGGFFTLPDQARPILVRVNPDGSPDLTFQASFGETSVTGIIPLPNGQIVIAGGFSTLNGYARSGVALLEANGSVSLSPPPVRGTDGMVTRLVRQPDGRLLIAGYFQTINGMPRWRLGRLHPDLTLDMSFDPSRVLQGYSTVAAIALQGDGEVLVGGDFSLSPFLQQFNLARLHGAFVPRLLAKPFSRPDQFGLTLFSQPGERYVLEGSRDLIEWTPVRTYLALSNRVDLELPGITTTPHLFYRSRQQ
ncbi:MAG TPA: Calx-beta domain-containing protein [Verrucomicrobiae bacterium]|nr:Calx-beta domain-containing protein [Verrucomicrobiae bacterium]